MRVPSLEVLTCGCVGVAQRAKVAEELRVGEDMHSGVVTSGSPCGLGERVRVARYVFSQQVEGGGGAVARGFVEPRLPLWQAGIAGVAGVDDHRPVAAWQIPHAGKGPTDNLDDEVREKTLLLVSLRNRQALGREPHPPVQSEEHVHGSILVRAGELAGLDVAGCVALAVRPLGVTGEAMTSMPPSQPRASPPH